MNLITCAYCGKAHDVSHIEPSLRRADPILRALKEHPSWIADGKDYAVLRPRRSLLGVFTHPRMPRRYFLRVNMPFAVAGRAEPISWGIWVEVSAADYLTVSRLWSSPTQDSHPPFSAVLANDIAGYPSTSGLPGKVQLRSPSAVPLFMLDPGPHPLVEEQKRGVTEETVMKWLEPVIH